MARELVISGSCRSEYARGEDTLIAAAAADIAGHRVGDLGIGGVVLGGEERRGLHDLTCLAVASLLHVERAPCLLHWVIALGVERLDRDHRLAGGIADRDAEGNHPV